MRPRWERYANPRFLRASRRSASTRRVPRCDEINRFLQPRTGFRAKPVSGYVPAYLFFDCLKRREFPTTITVRDGASIDYLPEPDIFHDIAGHVPMHTDRAFADALVRFGQFAERAARRAGEIRDEAERIRVVTSNVKGLARFFWFTVEFGLMREQPGAPLAPGQVRAYGSGLLSSYGELEHCVESPAVQRVPAQTGVDAQPVLRDPPLPAAAVRDRGLRAPLLPGARSGTPAATPACSTTCSPGSRR